MTNQLHYMEMVAECLDRGEQVESCYLDFRKAFDSVNHRLLLKKLKAYGIEENVVRCIEDFLRERSFWVQVGESKSAQANAPIAVPQGSVTGPLLFLIYVNDLAAELKNPAFLFADDVKIVASANTDDLQHDLDMVMK